ncbi:MAG: hypothetical protein QOD71_3184 [Thermoleophilaceae bacterium]|jgi:hypothetical protein|nr:hypothetical protein [Thermoleophilaceae bacterium]
MTLEEAAIWGALGGVVWGASQWAGAFGRGYAPNVAIVLGSLAADGFYGAAVAAIFLKGTDAPHAAAIFVGLGASASFTTLLESFVARVVTAVDDDAEPEPATPPEPSDTVGQAREPGPSWINRASGWFTTERINMFVGMGGLVIALITLVSK